MSKRTLSIIGLLFGIAGLMACSSGVAMAWDGAYQFALTVIWQAPYHYLSRFHSWIVWLPTVWASHATGNLKVLEFIYGAPYCFAPLVGFLMSCWVARKDAPQVLLWVTLGIGFGALPGQVFMINDSIFQLHLFWPFFLAALCPIGPVKRTLVGAFGFWQLSHPIGIALCGLTAAVAVDSAIRQPERRQAFIAYAAWSLLLSAGGIAKLFLFPDSYAASEASFGLVLYYFWGGVVGWPLLAIACVWTSTWLTWRAGTGLSGEDARRRFRIVLSLIGLATAFLVIWASNPHSWWKALDYRRWLVPLTLPFLLLAAWEGRRPPQVGSDMNRFRGMVACAAALMFALVLSVQSLSWAHLQDRLAVQVSADPGPVLAPESLAWTRETALDHWGTAALIITLQGREPHTLELDRKQLDELATEAGRNLVPLVRSHRVDPVPGPAGCFEFRPVLERIRAWDVGAYNSLKPTANTTTQGRPAVFR